jgi:hypothetical protein
LFLSGWSKGLGVNSPDAQKLQDRCFFFWFSRGASAIDGESDNGRSVPFHFLPLPSSRFENPGGCLIFSRKRSQVQCLPAMVIVADRFDEP